MTEKIYLLSTVPILQFSQVKFAEKFAEMSEALSEISLDKKSHKKHTKDIKKQLEELDGRIRSRLLDDRLCTALAITVKDSFAERRRRKTSFRWRSRPRSR